MQLAGLARHAKEFSKLAEAEQFLFEVPTESFVFVYLC